MSLFKYSQKKKVAAELRYLESAYDTLLFCSEFSKEVENFDSPESLKKQLQDLYEINIKILEDSKNHSKLRAFLTETEQSIFDEILSRPRPEMEFND